MTREEAYAKGWKLLVPENGSRNPIVSALLKDNYQRAKIDGGFWVDAEDCYICFDVDFENHIKYSHSYILDEHGQPQQEFSMEKWGMWFGLNKRQVAKHQFKFRKVMVSTIFLGLDHRHFDFHPENPPVLWETMIFGGQQDDYQDRYTSAEDALTGHLSALQLLTERRGCTTRTAKVFGKRIGKILERYAR